MKFQTSYSIKDLEQLSGIKAHTLRIWEKRFSLFKPERSDTNIRSYSNDDLKRILNISQLNKNGFKISAIAEMNDSEISEKVSAINLVQTHSEDLIENLIVAMIELNETHFDKIFTGSILRIGFENTIQKVIFPFFRRLGIMWQTGGINPAQEHFVSNIVRQKLIVAIDSLHVINEDKKTPTAILFLPENELHELSLLFYNYSLRSRNIRTVYLGQAVPPESLMRVIEIIKPDFLVGIMTNSISKTETETFLASLNNSKSIKKILLSGNAALEYKKKLPSRMHVFKDMNELVTLVQK